MESRVEILLLLLAMFQHLTKTQQTTAAGIILGGIFGISTGVSFVRGWDLVMILGIPLTLHEMLNLVNDCIPYTFAGLGFGSASGLLYSSFVTKSLMAGWWAFTALVIMFLIAPNALLLLMLFPLFLIAVGPAIVLGLSIFFLYRRQLDLKFIIPLVLLAGFLAAYSPRGLYGATGYVYIMRRTNDYAQQQQMLNYQLEYWGRDFSWDSSAIYLDNGVILKCAAYTGDGANTVLCNPFEVSDDKPN